MSRHAAYRTMLACAALAAAPGSASQSVADRAGALNLITVAALERHLGYLASDELEGRLTGEAGYDMAAQYVVDRFADFGLDAAGEDGWYQPVPLATYLIDTRGTTAIAHRDGNDARLEYREDYVMGGDKVRAENHVRAEVVYVGYGVHAPEAGYSDYRGVDVDGKIVAMFSGAPAILSHNERAYYASSRTKALEAASRGAVGTLGLRSRKSQESRPWDRIRKSAGTRPGMTWITLAGEADNYHEELRGGAYLSAPAATRLFDGTPISFTEALDAIEASRVASVPLGFEVTLARRTVHDRISSPNVIGLVRGTDPVLRDEYVVFSAHLDHLGRGVPVNGDDIYNGAYDNAMGIALLIEAARAIAADPPRRSVLFIAATGEERGLLGSDYFAHYPTVPIDAIVANVNLDMPLFLYPLADLVAFGSEHSSLERTVSSAAGAEGFTLSPDPMPGEVLFVRSDQYSFVRKGVPSIFLVAGHNSTDPDVDGAAVQKDFILNHYHRPSDDLSQPVDWPSALRFARANARIGFEVADQDDRPTWNDGDFFGERFGRD